MPSIRLEPAGLADHVARLRQVVFFLRRGERNSGVQSSDTDDGAVEIIESLFVDDGCDLTSQASRAGVLVQNDDLARLPHGLRDGFAIEWRDSSQVEDFDRDSVVLQTLGSLRRGVNHSDIVHYAQT